MIMQYKKACKLPARLSRNAMALLRFTIAAIVLAIAANSLKANEPDWCRHLPRAGFAKLEKILVDSDWFEVHRIQPGVYAISEPRQFEEVISYLIVGSKRALLWDSGMGMSRISDVVRKLSSVPVIVLNSHTHPDHIGGNHEFTEVWGLQKDFTRQNSKGYSDPELKDWVAPSQICGKLPKGFNRTTYSIKPFRISRFVKDRDVIDLGGRQLEVLHTPGHTPDALCLYDKANKILFTGDTFYEGPIYLYSPETNFDEYAASVKRLAELSPQIDFLLTAHNEPVAAASSLDALHSAVEQIRNGTMKPMNKDGLEEYYFQNFSILLKPRKR